MEEDSSLRSSNIYKNHRESIDGCEDRMFSLNLTARVQSEKMGKTFGKL